MLNLYNEFDEDFLLLGVQTPIVDETKFVFLLNQTFYWKLKRINDLDITFNQNTFCFSSFLYEDTHNPEDYIYVIKNQSHTKMIESVEISLFQGTETENSRYLLNKYSQYQFLIKIPEDTDTLQIKHLTLTKVEFIHNIQPISKISKKEKKYFFI